MLFVMGAMAALSIDVVTFYTARSEAQLAADGAALAGARVLANSGMTSSTDPTLAGNAATLCQNVAKQVAQSNQVGGQSLAGAIVTCNNTTTQSNPTVVAQVQVNLPTFFARIWGTTQVTVTAKATAEAYNPSGLATGTTISQARPVSLTCVKPWLLPNIDPKNTALGIFDPTSGAIQDPTLLGSTQSGLLVNCPAGGCNGGLGSLAAWSYYPGDTSSTGAFPAPAGTSVVCSPTATGYIPTPYQLSIAGCVQMPIACNATNVLIDLNPYPGRDTETFAAVNCVSHSATSLGDKLDSTTFPAGPFEFLAGDENPLVKAGVLTSGSDVEVSDSLVTVPVYDSSLSVINSVNLVGFVQLFLNSDGNAAPNPSQISTTIINMVGCGTGANGTPVLGNGASAVPVRLITPP